MVLDISKVIFINLAFYNNLIVQGLSNSSKRFKTLIYFEFKNNR